MAGYVRVICDDLNIRVRFESVGRRDRFNILLDFFRATFPLATWDERSRAWQLPAEQIAKVAQFCAATLGRGSLLLEHHTTATDSRQLALV